MKYLKDKEYKRLLQDSYELGLVKKSLKRHIEVLDQYRQDNHDLTMALEAAKKIFDEVRHLQ